MRQIFDFNGIGVNALFSSAQLNVGVRSWRNKNMTTKEKMKEIIEEQPEDASYEEIVRELAFAGMIEPLL